MHVWVIECYDRMAGRWVGFGRMRREVAAYAESVSAIQSGFAIYRSVKELLTYETRAEARVEMSKLAHRQGGKFRVRKYVRV